MRVGVEQPAHRGLQPAGVAMLREGAPCVRLDEALHVDVRAAAAPRQQPRIVPWLAVGLAIPPTLTLAPTLTLTLTLTLALALALALTSILEGGAQPAMVRPAWLGLGRGLGLGLGLALALGLGLRLDGPAGPRARRAAARTRRAHAAARARRAPAASARVRPRRGAGAGWPTPPRPPLRHRPRAGRDPGAAATRPRASTAALDRRAGASWETTWP